MRCRTLSTSICTILALSLLCAGPARANAAPPVGDVVKRMQAFYNETKDLKSKFKQVYTDTLYNRQRTSYGYLYVRKPGMMRWNYVRPERKAFVADGKELWVWEPEDKQAFRNPLSTSTLSTGLTFLLGSGDLTKEFRVSRATKSEGQLGGPDSVVLKLLPIEPTAQYQHLLLAVRPSDYAVTESMVVSKSARNHFIFSQLKTNTRLSKGRFRFRPPAGTRIIDGSKLRK